MSLIQKKNLRARKGTQKWRRNIDTSELENQIFEKSTSELHRQNALKKISKTIGFRIDSAPTQKLRAVLPADRFTKKRNDFVSKVESRTIKRINRVNLASSPKIIELEPKNDGEIYDAWEDEENAKKRNEFFKNEIGVALPHPGQSYNPSFKDHQTLLGEIVESEKKKDEIIHKVSNKVGRKRESTKKKTLSDKKLQNIEKDKYINLKNIKKELDNKDKIIKQSKTIRKQREQEKLRKVKVGLTPAFKGEGQIPEFQLETDFASSLTKLKPTATLTNETFQKINRRERAGDPFGSRRRSKVAKYKFHNKEKRGNREERELGQRFNVYDY